jgi:hypothetical protein
MAPPTTSSDSVIVNSNGAFFKLSENGLLEEIPTDIQEERTSRVVGLTQNPASSVSKPIKQQHGEQTGLVGTDVHGTRLFIRARI